MHLVVDSLVTEGSLSSAPITSQRTRRPHPKPKTTTTTDTLQTKPGKCGFLLKGVGPGNSWESEIETDARSDKLCEPIWVKTQNDSLLQLLSVQRLEISIETGFLVLSV